MTATKKTPHRPPDLLRPLRLDAGRGRSTSASTSTRPPTTSPSSATGAGLVATWVQPAGPELLVERLEPVRDAGRPGRLRGRAHRLRPGPPPPGRGLQRRGDRPVEDRPPRRARRPRATGSTAASWPSSPRRACCGRSASPTEQEEADRQVLRLREQLVRKPARSSSRSRPSSCSTASPSRPGLAHWSDAAVDGPARLELDAGAAVLPGRDARRAASTPGSRSPASPDGCEELARGRAPPRRRSATCGRSPGWGRSRR